MSEADTCCQGDAQNSSLPLKMKWADLMCRPAWKVIWSVCVTS